MRKNLLIVAPEAGAGQPVTERTRAFVNFFRKEEIDVGTYPTPTSLTEFLKLIRHIYKEGYRNVFLTMPPFRYWSICALPRVNVILDIRDGWSIAMRTGYGNTTRPAPLKARLARVIEQIAILKSGLSITCTPGLVRYHSTRLARRKIILIPNGFPDHEFPLVENIIQNSKREKTAELKRFICAGKFSEYGEDKIKEIITHISRSNKNFICCVDVYNRNPENETWVNSFINEMKIKNVIFNCHGFIERDNLIRKIISSDYGITIVRDPTYEFGTKIFDYIVCKLKIVNFPNRPSHFTEYFRKALDGELASECRSSYLRSRMIEREKDAILDSLV